MIKARSKSISKVVSKSVAVFMALLMTVGTPLEILAVDLNSIEKTFPWESSDKGASSDQLNADNKNTLYVCDVASATAGSYAEAKKSLTDKGYVVLDQNMNDGVKGGRCCLIGYKLTSDRSKALTALSTMEMSGGYDFVNYRTFLEENTKGLDTTVKGFMASVEEFKRRVKEKNPMAVYAYDMLNILCVPEENDALTGAPLGEYLISDAREKEDFETLLLVLCADTITYINNLLACGCSGCVENTDKEESIQNVSDPEWLVKSANQAIDLLENIKPEDAKAYVDPNTQTAKDAQKILDEITADEDEIVTRYLDETIIQKTYKNVLTNKKVEAQSLLDFLTKDDLLPVVCFLKSLPATINAEDFFEIVEIFALDSEQKIPKTVAPLPEIVSPWMRDMVGYLNTSAMNPFDAEQALSIIEANETIENDNELFIRFIKDYIETYRKQDKLIQECKTELGKDATTDDVIKAYSKKITELNEKKEAGEAPEQDYIYYAGTYQVLQSYKIDQKDWLVMQDDSKCANLAQYFELIADSTGNAQTALAYAFTSSLKAYQIYNAKSVGIPMFILNGTLLHSNQDDIRKKYEENKEMIQNAYKEAGFKENQCSVWFGSNKDLLDNGSAAMTSSNTRLSSTKRALNGSYESLAGREKFKQTISKALEITGLIMPAAGVLWAGGAFGLHLAGGTAFATSVSGLFSAGFGTVFGCTAATALSAAGVACAIIGSVGYIVQILGTVAMVVMMVINIAVKVTDKYKIEYTEIPTVMFDCELDGNGSVGAFTQYDVVRDVVTGNPADLNDMKKTGSRRWQALYYTRSTEAGSPLIAKPGSDTFLVAKTDDMNIPDKALPVSKFGYHTPYSLNAYNGSSKTQIYLFYYSENSVAGKQDRRTPGKYLLDIKISIAKSEEMAKNYILYSKDYSCLNYNLSPGTGFYTYLGYSTTNDESMAITDIRADYASEAYQLTWGDANYISAFGKEEAKCVPHKTVLPEDVQSKDKAVFQTEFCYNIYYSCSSSVGDPILADSLKVLESINDLKDGDEYIRWFSGGAFDFYSGLKEIEERDFKNHKFISFAPEESKRVYKKADSTEYLAGIAFFIKTYNRDIKEYAETYGYKVLPVNLSLDALDDIIHEKEYFNTGTYMAFAVTNNPKKAITDIGTFTGEPKGTGILPNNIARNGIGFEAAQVFKQKPSTVGYVNPSRALNYSHAYFSKIKDEEELFAYGKQWTDQSRPKYSVKPRGLYTSGPQSGMTPVKMKDLLYTTDDTGYPRAGRPGANGNICSAVTQNHITESIGNGWKSVHALDQYFYDEYDQNGDLTRHGTNLGLSLDEKNGSACFLYLFYRNEAEMKNKDGKQETVSLTVKRGRYISSVEIAGSVSEDSSYDEARIMAMACGQEIINPANPLYTQSNERYDVTDETFVYLKNDNQITEYSDKCYYLSVSYSDNTSGAVSSMFITKQDVGPRLPQSRILDYAGKTAVEYKKGDSIAPTNPDEKTEGYVVYTASHSGYASRIAVLETGLNENPFPALCRRIAEDGEGNAFSALGDMKQSVALYSRPEKYISSIKVAVGANPANVEAELAQMGYTQIIYADALLGTSSNYVMVGVKRQNSAIGAIQDLKISTEDLGESAKINGLNYSRVNDETFATTKSKAYPVYIYSTIGAHSSVKKWGARTALTNIAVSYKPGNTKRGAEITFWNGIHESNVYPDGIDEDTSLLDIVDAKDADSRAYLNKELFDDTYDALREMSGSAEAEKYKTEHGYTYLLFTDNSGYTYAEYAEMYKKGEATGNAAGDEKLWNGSHIDLSPSAIFALIGVLIALLAGVALFLYAKRRKKKNLS